MVLFNLFNRKEIETYEKQLSVPNDHITLKSSYTDYTNASAVYYNGMEEIESMWSVITNLGIYNTNESDILINKCIKNIEDLTTMLKCANALKYDSSYPPHVAAYVRLAMLYEKREDYELGSAVCIEAINKGAINDNSKGKMYGRLARLIKKSRIEPTEEMISLISMK